MGGLLRVRVHFSIAPEKIPAHMMGLLGPASVADFPNPAPRAKVHDAVPARDDATPCEQIHHPPTHQNEAKPHATLAQTEEAV